MTLDPRDRAKGLLERGLEGANDQQADYSHLRSRILWLQVTVAVLTAIVGVLIILVATTATSADQRSAGTLRYLQGKQGLPGQPGKSGAIGRPGQRGPGPTAQQIDAALRRCADRCRGDKGHRGPAGKNGRPPTFEQTLRAAQIVCGQGACRGERGRDPTPREILAAVAVFCSAHCKGDPGSTGNTGADGRAPFSWTFTDATGQTQTCVDPERDGTASCSVTATAPPPAPPPADPQPPPAP